MCHIAATRVFKTSRPAQQEASWPVRRTGLHLIVFAEVSDPPESQAVCALLAANAIFCTAAEQWHFAPASDIASKKSTPPDHIPGDHEARPTAGLRTHMLHAHLMVRSIQSVKWATRAQTPGYLALAQPLPQEVAPYTVHVPEDSHTSGPPLSPWQASMTAPLLVLPCAQSMSFVISRLGYPEFLQSCRLRTWTCASWSLLGDLPSSDKVPQPVIQQVEPGLTSRLGRHTVPTQPFMFMGLSNLRRPMSFSEVSSLYRGCFTHRAERLTCSLPLVLRTSHSPATT